MMNLNVKVFNTNLTHHMFVANSALISSISTRGRRLAHLPFEVSSFLLVFTTTYTLYTAESGNLIVMIINEL